MARIILTGAQSTGKTTILNKFREEGWNVVTEVVRNLKSEKGIKINREGNDDTQNIIFSTYHEVLSNPNDYISDRGLTDVLAYTILGWKDRKIGGGMVIRQREKLKKFIRHNPDILYIYFPIEFPLVKDGVRDEDEKYREMVDECIHEILEVYGVEFLTVHGSPEERFRSIKNYIKEKQEKSSI